jgi:hypothetical protein
MMAAPPTASRCNPVRETHLFDRLVQPDALWGVRHFELRAEPDIAPQGESELDRRQPTFALV